MLLMFNTYKTYSLNQAKDVLYKKKPSFLRYSFTLNGKCLQLFSVTSCHKHIRF